VPNGVANDRHAGGYDQPKIELTLVTAVHYPGPYPSGPGSLRVYVRDSNDRSKGSLQDLLEKPRFQSVAETGGQNEGVTLRARLSI